MDETDELKASLRAIREASRAHVAVADAVAAEHRELCRKSRATIARSRALLQQVRPTLTASGAREQARQQRQAAGREQDPVRRKSRLVVATEYDKLADAIETEHRKAERRRK